MEKRILKTLQDCLLINRGYMDKEDIRDLEEQIEAMEKINMNSELRIDLSSKQDTELLLKLIDEKKKADEQKKIENYIRLCGEYTMLLEELENMFEELENLHRVLRAIDYVDNSYHDDYKSIKYHYVNGRGFMFSHTRYWHYMRIEVHVEDWSINFYNIELDTRDRNKTLEWKILLLKEFLEIYPDFIKKMNKVIQCKLR